MARYIDLDNPKIHKMGRDKFGDVICHIPPDTPLADVRPNVHGEWVGITNHEFEDIQVSEAMCTNCNLYSSQMLAYGNISYEYCPRCGAKMRKGETNG